MDIYIHIWMHLPQGLWIGCIWRSLSHVICSLIRYLGISLWRQSKGSSFTWNSFWSYHGLYHIFSLVFSIHSINFVRTSGSFAGAFFASLGANFADIRRLILWSFDTQNWLCRMAMVSADLPHPILEFPEQTLIYLRMYGFLLLCHFLLLCLLLF